MWSEGGKLSRPTRMANRIPGGASRVRQNHLPSRRPWSIRPTSESEPIRGARESTIRVWMTLTGISATTCTRPGIAYPREAQALKAVLEDRFRACGLTLHPGKTKIVCCMGGHNQQDYPVIAFDFLSDTFRPRLIRNVLFHFGLRLSRWAMGQYRKLRGLLQAARRVNGLRRRRPTLFAHWAGSRVMVG